MDVEYIKINQNFYFPVVKNKRIAICMTDGADSALLTYILLTLTTNTIYVITSSVSKHCSDVHRAVRTLNKIMDLTNNHNVYHILDYSGDTNNIFNATTELMRVHAIDVVYTGTNATPPAGHKMYEKYKNTPEMVKRDPYVQRDQVYNDQVIVPFTNLDKRKIKDLYVHFGIIETVYPMTFSCLHVDREFQCGTCPECEERMYGFGNLN